jgi:ribonuclease P protein component
VKSTIKSSADISLLFSQGKRISTPFVTVLAMKRSDRHDHDRNHGRVAFIAGKKLGCAVWRNSAKRRMRAIVCDLGGPWEGYDIAFMARPPLMKASYGKVRSACEKALIKADIVNPASR